MRTKTADRVPLQWRHAAPVVDGQSVAVADSIPVANPADAAHPVGSTALADVDVLDRAVGAASAAFAAWRDLGAVARGTLIREGADALEAHIDDIAATIAAEVGKPLADARGDIGGSIAMLRSFVALVTELEQNEDRIGLPGTGQASFVRIRHVPVGPVGVIGPWNTPVFLAFNGIAPALASGCTVVVKPPAEAPLGLTATLRILAAHLPPGVLNVVPGRGSVIGSALAAHPGIRAVMFTGGTHAGRSVAVAGASNVKKVALELGGNDAAIVLADARIDDDLVTEMAAGCFSVSGQVCFNIKRIYVHRSRHDEFIERFSAAVSRIVVGDPFDPTVHMGPLTTREGYENALRLLEAARTAGADVVPLGIRAASADWDSGTYIAPTLVTGLPHDHELVLDEQFAPIIPVVPFDTDDEAIYETNRTEFGLSSSVWSADVTHAEDVARRIEAGNTYINVHRLGASVPLAPFGGVKQSGSGRTHGLHSLHHCTEEHAIIAFDDPSTKLPGIAGWQSIVGNEEERA